MGFLILYGRRTIGFVAYLVLQFLCYVFIAYLTVSSHSIQSAANSIGFLKFFAPSIVPAAVSSINAVFPIIIRKLTTFEQWESGVVEVNIRIFRMFLSRILNLLILGVAYGMLADPFLLASSDNVRIRKSVEIEFTDNGFKCRLDQTGDGMISLVFTDFVVSGTLLIAGHILYQIFDMLLGRPHTKLEFDTAASMVAILYSTGLLMLLMPFAPISMIFAPVLIALKFKWEIFVAIRYSLKPKKPWQAHAAGRTFTLFYQLTLFFIGVSSAFFFLGTSTFAKSCHIQDSSVHLCKDAVDPVTETCTLDTESPYFVWFTQKSAVCGIDNYPACLCHGELACGPFVGDSVALDSFQRSIIEVPFLGWLWTVCIEHAYGTWVLVLFLGVIAILRSNSFRVTKAAKVEKELQYTTHIASLQLEQKRQLRIIQKLKMLEGAPLADNTAYDNAA